MSNIGFIFVIAGVIFNALGQIALKSGALMILKPDTANSYFEIFKSAINFPIFLGLVFYVVSVSLWIVALTKVPVSIAYPMLSIGYVIVTILGYYLYNEPITIYKLSGLAIIIFGVILISRA